MQLPKSSNKISTTARRFHNSTKTVYANLPVFSATLSKIFSSSFSCFSLAVSFRAAD